MKLPATRSRDSLELKMTPMIDVVFLLLVFFVWTSSFELPEFDLPSAIAEPPAGGSEIAANQPPTEPFDEVVVRISSADAATSIMINGDALSNVGAWQDRLRAILALGVQPPVIIEPDDEITMNVAVAVYDAAREAGADRVLFAAAPEA